MSDIQEGFMVVDVRLSTTMLGKILKLPDHLHLYWAESKAGDGCVVLSFRIQRNDNLTDEQQKKEASRTVNEFFVSKLLDDGYQVVVK